MKGGPRGQEGSEAFEKGKTCKKVMLKMQSMLFYLYESHDITKKIEE